MCRRDAAGGFWDKGLKQFNWRAAPLRHGVQHNIKRTRLDFPNFSTNCANAHSIANIFQVRPYWREGAVAASLKPYCSP